VHGPVVVLFLVSLFPLAAALVLIRAARGWTERALHTARNWLIRYARIIGAVIVLALAASMLGNGINGLIHA
jgi:hypothetical protein